MKTPKIEYEYDCGSCQIPDCQVCNANCFFIELADGQTVCICEQHAEKIAKRILKTMGNLNPFKPEKK